MNRRRNSITLGQLFFLIVQSQVGVRLLTLPYDVFTVAKGDGWLSILVAGGITQIFIIVIWMLNRRFPRQSLFGIFTFLFGNKWGSFLSFIYFGYFVMISGLILILFSQTINVWVLPETPFWVIELLLIIPGIYIAKGSLKVLARFHTLVFIFSFFLLPAFLYTLKDANILYLLPLEQSNWFEIIKGSGKALFALLGFELLLVIYPYVIGTNREKLKIASLANGFVVLIYVITTLLSYMYFSPSEMVYVPEPVLYMFKSYTFPFIERVDLAITALWMFIVSTSYTVYFYITCKGLASSFRSMRQGYLVFISVIPVFALAILPKGEESKIHAYSQATIPISLIFTFIIPLVLLLYSYLFRKKEVQL